MVVIVAAAAGGVLEFVVRKRRIGTRVEPRSVATTTAAGASLGLVSRHGAQPVHLHGQQSVSMSLSRRRARWTRDFIPDVEIPTSSAASR